MICHAVFGQPVIDELLGRAELKERIDELTEERDRLAAQLNAERERRADAQTARQEAEEELNRLEDRVADLEGQVDRLGDEGTDRSFRGTTDLRGDRLVTVLDRVMSFDAGPEGALTAVVTDDPPEAVREAFGDRATLLSRAAPCVALTDDAGLVSAALSPPVMPSPFVRWDRGFDLDRSWFEPTGRYALALVRADRFALGEYDAGERVGYRGFESEVKGDHSKGGFSQARFERLRDEQIAAHVDRCRETLVERDTDRLYLVGDWQVIDELVEAGVDPRATAAVDASGDPETALSTAHADFFTTRLYRV